MQISKINRSAERSHSVGFRELLAEASDHNLSTARQYVESMIPSLPRLGDIDRLLKAREPLSFETVIHGMIYVLAASNVEIANLVLPRVQELYGGLSVYDEMSFTGRGVSFLQGMACREVFIGLTDVEIAAMATAGLADCVVNLDLDEVVDTCGMGADKGFGAQFADHKTINASTLSAIVISSMGIPAIKHGSYGNTAKVGSTDAAKQLGLPMEFEGGLAETMEYWLRTRFLYMEAYAYKTIHDLSHLVKHETVNHLIGPMSVPVSSATILHKVIGVNHHVDPRDVVKGYNELHRRGLQTVGGVMALCGLDQFVDSLDDFRQRVVLDELSPYSTVVAVGHGDKYFGAALISPADFGMRSFGASDIQLENVFETVELANAAALKGEDRYLADYLAANAALVLVTREGGLTCDFVHDPAYRCAVLREAFERTQAAIYSGTAWAYKESCS